MAKGRKTFKPLKENNELNVKYRYREAPDNRLVYFDLAVISNNSYSGELRIRFNEFKRAIAINVRLYEAEESDDFTSLIEELMPYFAMRTDERYEKKNEIIAILEDHNFNETIENYKRHIVKS